MSRACPPRSVSSEGKAACKKEPGDPRKAPGSRVSHPGDQEGAAPASRKLEGKHKVITERRAWESFGGLKGVYPKDGRAQEHGKGNSRPRLGKGKAPHPGEHQAELHHQDEGWAVLIGESSRSAAWVLLRGYQPCGWRDPNLRPFARQNFDFVFRFPKRIGNARCKKRPTAHHLSWPSF